MIQVFLGRHVDRQSTIVFFTFQLGDQFSVVDFALPHADLECIRAGVSEVRVDDKLQDLVQRLAFGRTGNVDAGVQGDAQAIDVVAKHHQGVGVFAEAAQLAADRDTYALGFRDADQPLKVFDFFIERRAQFRRRHGQIDDLGGLGDPAQIVEVVVVLVTCAVQFDAVTGDVQPVGVPKQLDSAVRISQDFAGASVRAGLVDGDLDRAKIQVLERLDAGLQVISRPTFRRSSDKQFRRPFSNKSIGFA